MSNESNTSVTSEVAESIHKMLREHTEKEKIFPIDIDTVLIQKEGGVLLEVPLPVYIKSQEDFKSAEDEAIKQARILFYRDNRASSRIPYSPEAEEDLSSGQWWLRLVQQIIGAVLCICVPTTLGFFLSPLLFFAGDSLKPVNQVSTHYGANATDFAYAMLPVAGFFIGVLAFELKNDTSFIPEVFPCACDTFFLGFTLLNAEFRGSHMDEARCPCPFFLAFMEYFAVIA